MTMEWIVTIVLVVAGLIAAVGLYLGQKDPSTRPYKPSIAGLFFLGRTMSRPINEEPRDKDQKEKDTNDGRPGPSKL